MSSGSFASSYVETVRLLDPTCHNFPTSSLRNPRNSVTKHPLFLRNTLTPVPRNNVARYSGNERQRAGTGYSRLKTQDSGLRTQDSGLKTQDSGLRTQDPGLRTRDPGLRTRHPAPGIRHCPAWYLLALP